MSAQGRVKTGTTGSDGPDILADHRFTDFSRVRFDWNQRSVNVPVKDLYLCPATVGTDEIIPDTEVPERSRLSERPLRPYVRSSFHRCDVCFLAEDA